MINVVLFQPEIAQNVGTIIRTCAGLECNLFIIHPIGFVWNDKKLKRAGLDYFPHINIKHLDHINQLPNARVIATSATAELSYTQINYQQNDMLLFGKESTGLQDLDHDFVNELLCVKIPIVTRSLNLAVSVGIVASYAVYKTNFYAK